MPYNRGSAGTADMFTKIIFDSCEVEVHSWKEGLAPDLEAFVMPNQKTYAESYNSFFHNPLKWTVS